MNLRMKKKMFIIIQKFRNFYHESYHNSKSSQFESVPSNKYNKNYL